MLQRLFIQTVKLRPIWFLGTGKSYLGLILALNLLLLTTPATRAGGWASVSLDELPVEPYAGETIQLGFTIRQHGVKPVNGVWGSEPFRPRLNAQNQETGETIQFEARQKGPVGHFVVDVTFPNAGAWSWGVSIEPLGTFPEKFEPLNVLPPRVAAAKATLNVFAGLPETVFWSATSVLVLIGGGLVLAIRRSHLKRSVGMTIGAVGLATSVVVILVWPALISGTSNIPQTAAMADTSPAPNALYGRALFIAKGCSACHIHTAVSQSVPGPLIGPRLTNYQSDPDFVRQWLRDPQVIRPDTQMPNLELSDLEIESLLAFLLISEKTHQ